MAAVTLLGTQVSTTASGSKAVTATPAVGDLIVLVTYHTGNTASVAPTDDNFSGTYTAINTAVKATSADTLQMWVRNKRIESASSTTFTHNPGTTTGGGVGVMKITGMVRSGASSVVRQSAIQSNQTTTGTAPAPVLAGVALTTNPLIGALFNATNAATMTARSSPAWTERFDDGFNSPTTGIEVMSIDSGETSATITWGGNSGSAWCSMVVELDATAPTAKRLGALGVG